MTHEKFEERSGLNLTTQEFSYTSRLYTAVDLTEDVFIGDYVRHRNSWIIKSLLDAYENLLSKHEQMAAIENEATRFLLSKSREYNDKSFRDMAGLFVSKEVITLHSVEMGLPLWEDDKEIIKDVLTNITKK